VILDESGFPRLHVEGELHIVGRRRAIRGSFKGLRQGE